MRGTGPAHLAVGASVAATATALAVGTAESLALRLGPLVAAFAAFAAVVVLARGGRGPSTRAVLVGAGALLALAVAVAPQHSRDVYLYGMQGRIVAAHGANPYTAEPRDFPDDPLLAEVEPAWHDGGSLYGPGFTAVEAAVAAVAGESPTAHRLGFQLVAAAAVAAALALLHRAGTGAGGLALLGLNPLVVTRGVNEAHADVLLGVLLLAAVLAVRRRPLLGALLLGLAALVKPFALVAGVGLVVWLIVRRGWRTGLGGGLAAAGTVALGYLVAGGPTALRPLREAGLHQSRSSLWAQPRRLLTDVLGEGRAARELVGLVAAALVLVVLAAVVVLVLRRPEAATAPDPALAVAAAFLAYLLASVYVPAWYVPAALPVAAVCWRSRAAVAIAAQGAVLALVYVDAPELGADPLAPLLRVLSGYAVPVAEAVVVVALVAQAGRALWRDGLVRPRLA